MHESVIEFGHQVITDAAGKRVLEIGAYNINGSLRPWIEQQGPKIYIGTDLRKCDHRYPKEPPDCGRSLIECSGCSDLAIPGEELCNYFLPGIFDIVVSTEVLEHVVNWKEFLISANTLLANDGYMVLTTRGPGFPLHEMESRYKDIWRFTLTDMKAIFEEPPDCGRNLIESDPQAPGVFVKARKVSDIRTRLADLEVERVIRS